MNVHLTAKHGIITQDIWYQSRLRKRDITSHVKNQDELMKKKLSKLASHLRTFINTCVLNNVFMFVPAIQLDVTGEDAESIQKQYESMLKELFPTLFM